MRIESIAPEFNVNNVLFSEQKINIEFKTQIRKGNQNHQISKIQNENKPQKTKNVFHGNYTKLIYKKVQNIGIMQSEII